jgi:hypothetical protein
MGAIYTLTVENLKEVFRRWQSIALEHPEEYSKSITEYGEEYPDGAAKEFLRLLAEVQAKG